MPDFALHFLFLFNRLGAIPTRRAALHNVRGHGATGKTARDTDPARLSRRPECDEASVLRDKVAYARTHQCRRRFLGARLRAAGCGALARSEERRVGKECRSRWSAYQ